MNLTFHIIRKDLRTLRWGFVLWVATCLTHLGLRLAQHARGDAAPFTPFWISIESSNRWDYLAVVGLPILLIPVLLHLDPLRGRLAFWKTVPIARTRLLWAKAIVVLAFFVALPLLCEVTYFLAAGLAVVLDRALMDWAWRFLPGIAAVIAGCLLTRSLKVGVPAVAVCLAAAAWIFQWPYGGNRPGNVQPLLSGRKAPKPSIIAPPAGSRIEIDPKSFSFRRTNYSNDSMMKNGVRVSEERLSLVLQVSTVGLPDDVVVASAQVHLDDIQLPGRTVPTLSARPALFTYASGSGLPVQEQRQDMARTYYDYNGENADPNHWALSSAYLPLTAKELPADGIDVHGTVRVALSQRHRVTTLPLQDGATWAPGLHRLVLSKVSDPGQIQASFHAALATVLADPTGATGGLALTPQTTFALWLEHNTLPYRAFRLSIPATAWRANRLPQSFTAPVWEGAGSQQYARTDLTRSRRRLDFDQNFNPVDARRNQEPPLALMRFAEEQALVRNWHLAIVTYSDLGTIELPFQARVPRPAAARAEEEADELRALAPPLAAVLSEIEIPAKPNREEAKKAMAEIVQQTESRSEKTVRDQEKLLLGKLTSLGTENIEVLLAAAAASGRGKRSYETPARNRGEWSVAPPDVGTFWRRVLSAACDMARPEDKALFLKYHSPRVDLLGAIEEKGWEADALPTMYAFAKSEPIPEAWRKMLVRHPGPETRAALLGQIRQRTLSPRQLASLIDAGAVSGREAAETLWDTVTNNTGDIDRLQPAFALAVRYGVDSIPRDLLRILRMRKDDWSFQGGAPYKTQQSAFVQSFALRSDCPPTVNEAAAWMEQNAFALAYNATNGRYELPGKAAPRTIPATWGTFSDPVGLGEAKMEGGDLILTCGGDNPVGVNEFPRVMREMEGDFTAEVTVAPAFDMGRPWDRRRADGFESAGLLLIAGDSRWIRWEHGLYKTQDGHELREEIMRAGRNTVTQWGNDQWNRAKPVRLRLSRHGDLFTTAWRQGDGAWVESPARRNIGWPKKVIVGPAITNSVIRPFTARFADYQLAASSAEPAKNSIPIDAHPLGPATPEGTSLGDWGVVENPIQSGLFTVEANALSIAVAPLYSDYNIQQHLTAPRVMREVDGDFTFEVTIEPTARLDWNSSEVLLTAGPDFYFRFEAAVGWGTQKRFQSDRAEGGWKVSGMSFDQKPDVKKPFRLRVQRRGQFLHVAFQQDGGEWVAYRPADIRAWPAKIEVGVAALNTSKELFTAKFSDVKLTLDKN